MKAEKKSATISFASPRKRLLATARELFYREGPRAVGIDRVLAESGVSKMSLYRYFPSKDQLIAESLKERNDEYWAHWDASMAEGNEGAAAKLRTFLLQLADRSSQPGYRGCPFLNTTVDFAEADHPARIVAAEHKRKFVARLTALCTKAGSRKPKALAQQLLLLIHGAQSTAGILGRENQRAVIDAGETLLRAHGI